MSQPDTATPSWWFAFRGSELLVYQDDAGLRVPAGPRWPVGGLTPLIRHHVGQVHDRPAHAVELPGDAAAPPGMAFLGLRAVLGGVDPALARAAGRAAEILEWERANRYCGACGTPTAQKDGDRALLARSHRFPPVPGALDLQRTPPWLHRMGRH